MQQSLTVNSPDAPAAVGPYCQARWAGGLLFLSGQLGLEPASGELVAGGVAAQARQAMENLGQVLSAAGLGWAQVAKCTIFLTDMGDFAQVNEVYQEFFAGLADLPARACIAVAGLPKGGLVEVEAVACR
ncbi:MAG: Rid family detoxifying hydrolase [Desulfarculaceae bacterium]|nr:Rid family detoxifying hydrolase [Desulfarculaceae bacterium]MCF8071179.1 Rid family detoxifying hydrolase [Desulfarculaceae bacterium]MCF8101218.1 Rid family detoxifying hydrolase [Desulfarculaceae bacterium]MCF8115233.1 Rid family detoxifying hydrolase [Desulfarculaceae bacterium]